MAQAIKTLTAITVDLGSWTSALVTDLNTADTTYANITGASKNVDIGRLRCQTFNFDTAIPATATISQVDILVEWKVSTTASIPHLGTAPRITSTIGTYNENSAEPTTDTVNTYANVARPGGGAWTRNDLLDGTFEVMLRARQGNSSNSVRYDFDYIEVTVTYTIPPPSISSGSMADSGRDWTVETQEISITFSEAMKKQSGSYNVGDTIPGLTAQINGGANSALTYVSGQTTATWVVKRAELIQNNDTVVVDYAQASGEIYDNATGLIELDEQADKSITNNLTKRVRVTLKDKNNNTVVSETVKYALMEYDSATPANANWMSRTDKGTVATDTNGLFDVQYTGSTTVGSAVYVIVIRPNTTPTECFVWNDNVR